MTETHKVRGKKAAPSRWHAEVEMQVQFFDLDPMEIVWHGRYVKYLEVVRCALLDSIGYNSIGGLSRSLGQKGFGTRYAYPKNGVLPDDEAGGDVTPLPVDLAANARSLGAIVFEVKTHEELVEALRKAETTGRTTVIAMQVDRYVGVPGYDSWWDVHVAEVSEMDSVRDARKQWEVMRAKERYFL